jgi:hypothetical protein
LVPLQYFNQLEPFDVNNYGKVLHNWKIPLTHKAAPKKKPHKKRAQEDADAELSARIDADVAAVAESMENFERQKRDALDVKNHPLKVQPLTIRPITVAATGPYWLDVRVVTEEVCQKKWKHFFRKLVTNTLL